MYTSAESPSAQKRAIVTSMASVVYWFSGNATFVVGFNGEQQLRFGRGSEWIVARLDAVAGPLRVSGV